MKGDPPLILLPDCECSCPLHVQQTDPPLPNAAYPLLLDIKKKKKVVPLFQGDFSLLF